MSTAENIRDVELFDGLSDEDVERIMDTVRPVSFAGGEVLCRRGEKGDRMFILIDGRVKVSIVESDGEERVLNYLGVGDHFGELSMLIGAPRSATITAAMDTTLLEIRREDFDALIGSVPGFAVNLSRSLGRWLRSEISGERRRTAPRAIAVIRVGERVGQAAIQTAEALGGVGVGVQFVSDRDESKTAEGERVRCVRFEAGDGVPAADLVRRSFAQAQPDERLLIDLPLESADPSVLMQCERVWWLADAADEKEASRAAERLIRREKKAGRSFANGLGRANGRIPAGGRETRTAAEARRLADRLGERRPRPDSPAGRQSAGQHRPRRSCLSCLGRRRRAGLGPHRRIASLSTSGHLL